VKSGNLLKFNQTPTNFMQSRQALFLTQCIVAVLCLVSVMCQVYLPETSATCIPCPEGLDCQPGADEKDIGIKSTQHSHISRTARIAIATKHHTDILKIPQKKHKSSVLAALVARWPDVRASSFAKCEERLRN
jgi:hypothetical protein